MNARFETVDRRFESLERRLDRTSETLRSIDTRMGALNTWADTLDRDSRAIADTQYAQQRAIDDLAARVAKLEANAAECPTPNSGRNRSVGIGADDQVAGAQRLALGAEEDRAIGGFARDPAWIAPARWRSRWRPP